MKRMFRTLAIFAAMAFASAASIAAPPIEANAAYPAIVASTEQASHATVEKSGAALAPKTINVRAALEVSGARSWQVARESKLIMKNESTGAGFSATKMLHIDPGRQAKILSA